MQPTTFVNIFSNARGFEAHDGVWTSRAEAVEAAEEHANKYAFTLTDAGKIDLAPEFSEAFQERKDFDTAVDAKIDEMKTERFAMEGA